MKPDISLYPPLAVYVHWPFCLSKCPYCDFNSHVRESVNQADWRQALLAEIGHYAALVPQRRVCSIFFGGGTPSLMPPDTVAAVIEAIRQAWFCDPDMEITLEANPTSSETARFKAFAQAGINRVSLGVQALDDTVLQFLGRTHSARHALDAVEMASSVFGRYSFDLIYARPDQTIDQWQHELGQALRYAGEHLSLYQLTIEKGTAFYHAHARGELKEIEDDMAAALYLATQEVMESYGLPAYEISNHAREGAESRHNLAYWRYQDYVGIGPGAHGRLTLEGVKHALHARRSPEKWLAQVQELGHGCENSVPLTQQEHIHERLMMGLRLAEGICPDNFARETGIALYDCIDQRKLQQFTTAGWVSASSERLLVQGEGRLFLNNLLAQLVA